MCRHGFDQDADMLDDPLGPRIGGVKHADRVHQFLDRHGRMVSYSDIQELANGIGRPALRSSSPTSPIKRLDAVRRKSSASFGCKELSLIHRLAILASRMPRRATLI
jgi:hypothetical protein